MQQLISVIVPIYNAEIYLARCIESLIHQTYPSLQIILVNDGSTDNSLSIAKQYAAQDRRVEVYSQTNKGQSAARNNGLTYAKGEYISFVDADDYIDTSFYQTLIQQIGENDCVQIGYRRIDNQGIVSVEKVPKHFYQFTSPCMRLYRRSLFNQHQLSFPVGMIYEDVIFSIDFWATNPTYQMFPYTGYNYVDNPRSTTSVRNIEAENKLFTILQKKRQLSNNVTHKLLILYTIIRLKFHFKRYE